MTTCACASLLCSAHVRYGRRTGPSLSVRDRLTENTFIASWLITIVLGFTSETATFIVECAEDEHDGVVSETHALKRAVEGVTGENILEGV
jgi:hypothetical protein